MKKKLLLSVGLLSGFVATAQLPVSTTPENKNVILEEFTGIACTFCPDGHVKANDFKATSPDDIFLVNVHVGGYANPQGPGTDFRTQFGTALANQSNLAGYPAGTVNRHEFAGMQQNGSGTAMSRGDWATAGSQILNEASYANVALEGTIDAVTRQLTVDVEVHFTGNTAPASVNLTVALLQNGVEGPQTGAANFNPGNILPNGNYVHNHMLRHFLTGQWGDVITTTTQGTTYSQQYTWTIPADLNDVAMELGDFEIVAFIAEGQQEIVTGNDGPLTYTNLSNDDAELSSVMTYDEICGTDVVPTITLKNYGDNPLTAATITYDIAGQNQTNHPWTGNLATFEDEEVTLPAIALPAGGGVLNVTISDANGNTDPVMTNNSMTTSAISETSNAYSGLSYTFVFNQDRYGSESTWEFVDDNGTVVSSGGPYGNLAANGTQAHTSQVNFPSTGCYTLFVYDSYGDGINAGYGNGSFSLTNNELNTMEIYSNGVFGSVHRTPFAITTSELSVEENELATDVSIYPNPVTAAANVVFTLNDATNSRVEIYNAIGEVVYTQSNLVEGLNNISIDAADLSNGMYFVTISNAHARTNKKFTVSK